jgi:hypothetical protein
VSFVRFRAPPFYKVLFTGNKDDNGVVIKVITPKSFKTFQGILTRRN